MNEEEKDNTLNENLGNLIDQVMNLLGKDALTSLMAGDEAGLFMLNAALKHAGMVAALTIILDHLKEGHDFQKTCEALGVFKAEMRASVTKSKLDRTNPKQALDRVMYCLLVTVCGILGGDFDELESYLGVYEQDMQLCEPDDILTKACIWKPKGWTNDS